MKQLVVIFTLWLVWMPVGAQKTLTLEECLKLGIENNLSLEGSRNEMRKAKHLLSENRAKLWPQISAEAGYNDKFNQPVSVTDGAAYGNLYNVTKTLQYNASAGLQLQMPHLHYLHPLYFSAHPHCSQMDLPAQPHLPH